MSGSLIDRVLAALGAAEIANPVNLNTGTRSREQEAAILIAQVQAILAGDAAIDVAADPAAPTVEPSS